MKRPLQKIRHRVSSLLDVGTGFHRDLTGRENVYLNGAILGMNKKEVDHQFDEIANFAGIERFIDTPLERYAGGMTVRPSPLPRAWRPKYSSSMRRWSWAMRRSSRREDRASIR